MVQKIQEETKINSNAAAAAAAAAAHCTVLYKYSLIISAPGYSLRLAQNDIQLLACNFISIGYMSLNVFENCLKIQCHIQRSYLLNLIIEPKQPAGQLDVLKKFQ